MDSNIDRPAAGAINSLVFDPICGMQLTIEQVAAQHSYLGESYGFCCEECRAIFARAPEAYLVNLAHDPNQSAGHLCPWQRQEKKDRLRKETNRQRS